jgi:hypothetical protein
MGRLNSSRVLDWVPVLLGARSYPFYFYGMKIVRLQSVAQCFIAAKNFTTGCESANQDELDGPYMKIANDFLAENARTVYIRTNLYTTLLKSDLAGIFEDAETI